MQPPHPINVTFVSGFGKALMLVIYHMYNLWKEGMENVSVTKFMDTNM